MPGLLTTPYDNAEYILQIMRALGNDAIQSIAGNLLSDNQPYIVPMLNSGYRHLQRKLALRGFQALKKTVQILNLTPIALRDPGATVSLGYSGYFNAVSNASSPALPADLLLPLKLKERQNNTTQIFKDMFYAQDGLTSRPQSIWMRDWVWQNDLIIMNGATQAIDLQVQYSAFLPELVVTPTPSPVLILRCENALGYYTLAKWAEARGSALATDLFARGDDQLKDIIATESLLKHRKNTRRQPYSRRAHAGWGWY